LWRKGLHVKTGAETRNSLSTCAAQTTGRDRATFPQTPGLLAGGNVQCQWRRRNAAGFAADISTRTVGVEMSAKALVALGLGAVLAADRALVRGNVPGGGKRRCADKGMTVRQCSPRRQSGLLTRRHHVKLTPPTDDYPHVAFGHALPKGEGFSRSMKATMKSVTHRTYMAYALAAHGRQK
jgi:hypothetical protein